MIRTQLENQPVFVQDEALTFFNKLSALMMVEEVSPMMQPLFIKSVEPYLISQFSYYPVEQISGLQILVSIVQGTSDFKVGIEDAESLHAALSSSKIQIVEGMNHTLKNLVTIPSKIWKPKAIQIKLYLRD
ncbi:MAG: hypothetical protein LAT67_11420 [Balneolales bacterium]|nr:hypothetical protein [Balneolales bacterium]